MPGTNRLGWEVWGRPSASARLAQDRDLLRKPPFQAPLLDLEIVARLQIHPEPFRGAEIAREAKRGVGRDCPLAVHDLVDTPWRNADVLRQPILAHCHRRQKFLEQNLSGVNGWMSLLRHVRPLVVVHNLHVVSVASLPAEADSPLVGDANAVLLRSLPRQPLEPVPRRNPEIFQYLCGIEEQQLPVPSSLHIGRQSPRPLTREDLRRLPIAEATNHPGTNNVSRYYRQARRGGPISFLRCLYEKQWPMKFPCGPRGRGNLAKQKILASL